MLGQEAEQAACTMGFYPSHMLVICMKKTKLLMSKMKVAVRLQ